MTTKTEIKKEELLKLAHDAIEIFRNYIERGDYAIELDNMDIVVRGNLVKAYLSRYSLFIMYGDIDIKHNDEITQILVVDKKTFETTRYDAHELHDVMTELRELTLEKVKEKVHKILSKI
jgi:hypothetical protein